MDAKTKSHLLRLGGGAAWRGVPGARRESRRPRPGVHTRHVAALMCVSCVIRRGRTSPQLITHGLEASSAARAVGAPAVSMVRGELHRAHVRSEARAHGVITRAVHGGWGLHARGGRARTRSSPSTQAMSDTCVLALPGVRSWSRRVPSGLPSLTHISKPCAASAAAKKREPPHAIKPWAYELLPPGLRSSGTRIG